VFQDRIQETICERMRGNLFSNMAVTHFLPCSLIFNISRILPKYKLCSSNFVIQQTLKGLSRYCLCSQSPPALNPRLRTLSEMNFILIKRQMLHIAMIDTIYWRIWKSRFVPIESPGLVVVASRGIPHASKWAG